MGVLHDENLASCFRLVNQEKANKCMAEVKRLKLELQQNQVTTAVRDSQSVARRSIDSKIVIKSTCVSELQVQGDLLDAAIACRHKVLIFSFRRGIMEADHSDLIPRVRCDYRTTMYNMFTYSTSKAARWRVIFTRWTILIEN